MKILAIGSPKGGVGKTTIAVDLADLYARAGAQVLVIDADDNGSAAFWIERSDGAIAVDWDEVDRPRTLAKLATITGYDVLIVDLPGSARKGGELRALLSGTDGRPVVDFLLVPTECADLDLHAVGKVLEALNNVPHAVVFTKVWPTAIPSATRSRQQYREAGWTITDTIVRRYSVHPDSVAARRSIVDMPGRHLPVRRAAEQDMRDLAREVAQHLQLAVTIDQVQGGPTPSPIPRPQSKES